MRFKQFKFVTALIALWVPFSSAQEIGHAFIDTITKLEAQKGPEFVARYLRRPHNQEGMKSLMNTAASQVVVHLKDYNNYKSKGAQGLASMSLAELERALDRMDRMNRIVVKYGGSGLSPAASNLEASRTLTMGELSDWKFKYTAFVNGEPKTVELSQNAFQELSQKGLMDLKPGKTDQQRNYKLQPRVVSFKVPSSPRLASPIEQFSNPLDAVGGVR